MPKFVSSHAICAPSQLTNLRVRRERQLRLSTGSPTNLLQARTPTSLRHVLIRTTNSSSLSPREGVSGRVYRPSPTTHGIPVNIRGQRPRRVISQVYCSLHVECDCYTCSRLICNCLWNSRAVCGATSRACFLVVLASRPGSTAARRAWVGRGLQLWKPWRLDWTALDGAAAAEPKASASAPVSSHATRCTQHAEPRTTT
jgi:hypothetical protein